MMIYYNIFKERLGEYQSESNEYMLPGWLFINRLVYLVKSHLPTVVYSYVTNYLKMLINEMPRDCIECITKKELFSAGTEGLRNAIIRVTTKRRCSENVK